MQQKGPIVIIYICNTYIVCPRFRDGLTFRFMLLSGTLSQYGHYVSCMTTRFTLANRQSRHQVQLKWTVNLVVADGHFTVPHGLAWVCGYSLHSPGGKILRTNDLNMELRYWKPKCMLCDQSDSMIQETADTRTLIQLTTAAWFMPLTKADINHIIIIQVCAANMKKEDRRA